MRDGRQTQPHRQSLEPARPQGEEDEADDGMLAGEPSRMATVAWGLAGFIIGAVFWHFIGFWSFVNDIVLKGRPDDGRIVAQAGHDCTQATRDRLTGDIVLGPCPLHAPQLAEIGGRGREDSDLLARRKKLDAPRWSILVSQDDEDANSSR